MATTTTNYELVKPADNETADIGVINANMDIIDTTMKELDNSKESLIKNAAAKTTMVDEDALPLIDSADGSKTKKLSFANLKILLKTIFATTEDITALNTSLSNAIMKDGSVQMTGALKTKGSNGMQILDLKNSICTYNDYYFLCSNCYYDGTNWRYMTDGVAMNFSVRGGNAFCSQTVFATGLKDAVCTGAVTTELLTRTTGLPLTGGGLSGNLTITKSGGALVQMVDASKNTNFMVLCQNALSILRNTNTNDGTYVDLQVNNHASSLANSLLLFKDATAYKLYGEHNITCSTVAPVSALAEGCQHQVY